MELNLEGKTALITGGSHGIGKAIKEELEKEGVKVYSWSRSEGINLEFGIPIIPNIDILINNFGGGGTWTKDWRQVFYRNFEVTKELTDRFISQNKPWGRVITISSIYGKEKGPNAIFTSAKSAQIAYMKSLAGRYNGTTFNVICPGHIDVGKEMPGYTGIPGKPEDVAGIVAFLCSEKARWINGAVITVDNGESYSF